MALTRKAAANSLPVASLPKLCPDGGPGVILSKGPTPSRAAAQARAAPRLRQPASPPPSAAPPARCAAEQPARPVAAPPPPGRGRRGSRLPSPRPQRTARGLPGPQDSDGRRRREIPARRRRRVGQRRGGARGRRGGCPSRLGGRGRGLRDPGRGGWRGSARGMRCRPGPSRLRGPARHGGRRRGCRARGPPAAEPDGGMHADLAPKTVRPCAGTLEMWRCFTPNSLAN